MIKETDASKNDERRVKNKLNPLTHIREGETRTMYNQSTKHWKLGAFFVISLMLVVGLFGNVVDAQVSMGNVTVSPTTVTAGIAVDLKVTYTTTTNFATADNPGTIQIQLPAEWLGAATSVVPLTDPPGEGDVEVGAPGVYLTMRSGADCYNQ